MFALPFFRRDSPALKGDRITLRLPESRDYREWAALRAESRTFLEPWEPKWAADELGRPAWRARLMRYREDYANGSSIAFFIFENASGRLVGGITIGNIRHGVAQSGQIGYWIGERFAGRGFMREALVLISHYAFDTLRLHRIEAACIPDNARSIRVLEKAGFQREGLLRSYLRIAGTWQDHYLYALIAEDRRGVTTKG
ncbi:GNAT family N-acetyltransferase [Pseudaminobacter sp. NGMCC 1.201702]|uniref:GNAT family N-acetyltransferase n=1 Tax=Pseudaminobacter sp. NGMCC 1.201702 TaxID=3391825 RepID=UPI0039F05F4C